MTEARSPKVLLEEINSYVDETNPPQVVRHRVDPNIFNLVNALNEFRTPLFEVLNSLSPEEIEPIPNLHREFFRALILGMIPNGEAGDSDQSHIASDSPARARAVPDRRDDAALTKDTLEPLAKLVLRKMNLDEREELEPAALLAIQHHLRKNLEALTEQRIFYLGAEISVSRREVETKFKGLQRRLADGSAPFTRGQAVIQGLYELGVIRREEIEQRSPLKTRWSKLLNDFKKLLRLNGNTPLRLAERDTYELENEINDACLYVKQRVFHLIKDLNELIRARLIDGSIPPQPYDVPSLKESVRGMDVYGWLETLFSKDTDSRDSNDAQILLNTFLFYWVYERYMDGRNMAETKARQQKILHDSYDELGSEARKSGWEPTLTYDGQSFHLVDSITARQELNAWISDSGRMLYFNVLDTEGKERNSCHFKSTKKERSGKIEDMPDLCRSREIVWGVSCKMIREDDALRAALEERLNQLAEKSDLIRRRDLDGDDRGLEKLDVGQYYLDIDLDGPFPKLCFIGRMNNGCPYEHQIIPFDTHCFELVANTGIDHEHLELKRLIDWARLNVPASLSPITHLAADATERMIDDKRRACINAMNEEGIQNFFGQVEKAFIS